jgi:ABC-2 type transport system ATP-binding protein
MEETADHVIVIGRGKLIADTSIADFTRHSSSSHVRVVSPQAAELVPLLRDAGATVVTEGSALIVTGMETPQIGYLAAEHRIEIHELSLRRASLETAFMELTEDSVEYQPLKPQAAVVTETAEALSGKATR